MASVADGFDGGLSCSAKAVEDSPTADFVDNGNGTVTHQKTGLSWMRCAMGQTWTGSTCRNAAQKYSWKAATALSADFAGQAEIDGESIPRITLDRTPC